MASNWEVVGQGKKGKGTTQHLTKTQKKAFIENMPRTDTRIPVAPSSTIYDSFMEKDDIPSQQKMFAKEQPTKSAASNDTSKKPVKKKVESDKKKEKQTSNKDPFAMIRQQDLEIILKTSRDRFPENQDVWMKDLASSIDHELDVVPEPDFIIQEDTEDFPMSQLSAGSKAVLVSALDKCSEQTTEHLFKHYIQCMIDKSAKGSSAYGSQIFIQLLARKSPNIAVSQLSQYIQIMRTNQNHHRQCPALLWALGQCGVTSLRCGLRVWLDVMQPMITVKSMTLQIVKYYEYLLNRHQDLSSAYSEISVREYFHLLDLIFSKRQTSLSKELQLGLRMHFPKLQAISYGASPSEALRNYFPSYLVRLTKDMDERKKDVLLSSLTHCMIQDKQCYSVWLQMYMKHQTQSGILIQHIMDKWRHFSHHLDKKMLKQTLNSFSVTNSDLTGAGEPQSEALQSCNESCKALLQKLDQSRTSWSFLFILLVITFGSFIAYDAYTSKSQKDMQVVRFLNTIGLGTHLENAWSRVKIYSIMVYNWLNTYIPTYLAAISEGCVWTWDKSQELTSRFIIWFKPHLAWAIECFYNLLKWIYSLSPHTWDSINESFWLSLTVIRESTVTFCAAVWEWLQENVLSGSFSPENIQKTVSSSLVHASNYTQTLIEWCRNLMFSSSK